MGAFTDTLLGVGEMEMGGRRREATKGARKAKEARREAARKEARRAPVRPRPTERGESHCGMTMQTTAAVAAARRTKGQTARWTNLSGSVVMESGALAKEQAGTQPKEAWGAPMLKEINTVQENGERVLAK